MIRPGRDRLKGTVEIDETYVGGAEEGVSGRQTETKAIVAIAVEVLIPKGIGRTRLQRVNGVSAADLSAFVQANVDPGTNVCTDGWGGYNEIRSHGYIHKKTIISSKGDPAHIAMPAVHLIASLLKRWLLSTHQGAVSRKHLDYYLDEFTFRFNRRTCKSRGKLFYRLAQQVVRTDPLPYRAIVAKPEVEPS